MIIYKIQENGRATDFQHVSECPNGWLSSESNNLPESDEDFRQFHAQQYIDYLDSVAYVAQRKAEYPSMEDQLDYIYHNGVDAWKADMIDPVKVKYPKPGA